MKAFFTIFAVAITLAVLAYIIYLITTEPLFVHQAIDSLLLVSVVVYIGSAIHSVRSHNKSVDQSKKKK